MARFFVLFLLAAHFLPAQSTTHPKLVVGIVVDQMRYDYLYRYAGQYGPDGFKKLLNEGLSCENTHYDYIPTYTGPGHACIYTGTGPAGNGVVANEWWDREQNRHRYVTSDLRQKTVGADGKAGQHSPAVMLSTTVTDELRLSNNFRSKVVGVCLKDRGSILPAGHIPNACYWFDDKTGNWITSTFYPDSLGLPHAAGIHVSPREREVYAAIREFTDARVAADEPIYLGVARHDAIVINNPRFLWLLDRPCATRYHELHPGITDREDVQREMIADLERRRVRCAVIWRFGWPASMLDRISSERRAAIPACGSTLLDDFLALNFRPALETGEYVVLWRDLER